MKRLVPLLGMLALAACTASRQAASPPITSLDQYAASWASTAAASPTPATGRAPSTLAFPAWFGRARAGERRSDGGETETAFVVPWTSKRDAGQDRFELTTWTAGAPGPDGRDFGSDRRPSEDGIRAELAARFPDTEMRVVTRPARNGYGPYGLAVGRSPAGMNCLYAWQWIDGEAAARLGASALSWRGRLCRPDASLDALASAIDRMVIGHGKALAVRDGAARPTREAARPTRPGRNRSASSRPAAPPSEPSVLPRPPADATGGRHYLGPVAGDPAPAPSSREPRIASGPALPAGAAASSGALADLPAEAYRGPGRPASPSR